MEETIRIPPPTAAELDHYHAWWSTLSDPWKIAYNEVMLRRTGTETPPGEALHAIWTTPALRFAGPSAQYPNMSIELDDLDGIGEFPQLDIFVFIHHRINAVAPLAKLPQLKSLFLFDNRIDALHGVEAVTGLREFYFQNNMVESLRPLEGLTSLHTVYCSNNRLRSLDGIGKQHAGTLQNFTCLPNASLPQAEVARVEQALGITCRKG